ncbi:MAG: threonine-phosphate decarboxylase [Nitrospirae bacterium]|nr:threonine-phosphate decarboxylase [Nitrospirota bacterium]
MIQDTDKNNLGSGLWVPGSEIEHGGNIYKLAEKLNLAENKVIDFSTSINPLGIPRRVNSNIKKWLIRSCNYPDPDATELREKISEYHNISPETILCGNGSTELIYLIPRALTPMKVLITAPTFSEYERACRISNKLRVMSYELKRENNFDINTDEFINAMANLQPSAFSLQPFAMAFLCNPNNPTGRAVKKDSVLKIADAAKMLKCYFIVDEAFIDFCPDNTVINNVVDNPYLIVLRSMTKFYSLSGLRIGYGVFPLHLIERLKNFKEPWSVNSLAQKAASAVIGDHVHANTTFKLIEKEKKFLEDNFKNNGIKFFPSDANFYLLKIKSDRDVVFQLQKKSILVRDCSNFKGLDSSYIRVAVKSRKDNTLLLKELSKLCTV